MTHFKMYAGDTRMRCKGIPTPSVSVRANQSPPSPISKPQHRPASAADANAWCVYSLNCSMITY